MEKNNSKRSKLISEQLDFKTKKQSICSLNVRSYKPEDGRAVKSICRNHIRSLCYAAVIYYCFQHYRDILAFAVIIKFFMSWKQLALSITCYFLYLFVRAVLELEYYLFKDCPDLDDILSYYFSSEKSHFWVAEYMITDRNIPEGQSKSSCKHEKNAPKLSKAELVGCVGCMPTRDDQKVAQLMRLVVDKNARRMRFGSRLLAQFELFALEKGFREVRLYTNNLNTSHMKFIRQHGYEIVQTVPRSLMRGALLQWRKPLTKCSDMTFPPSSGYDFPRNDEITTTYSRTKNMASVLD